jgi:uncharacterized protein YprB with RNaseH-like and TPR domain/predicted RNA-binding Zn-ribbon protein involved in translation (DUF1610 family)
LEEIMSKIKSPRILFFDIETCPCEAWVWSTGKQRVDASQILEPSRIICISYKYSDERKVKHLHWDKNQCDKKMLKEFADVAEDADVVMGHNGKNFDVRHINARVAYHSLRPIDFSMVEDTLMMTRKKFRIPSHKLDYIAQYFKVGGKLATGGISLWMDVWLRNDKKALRKMIKYCDQDVRLLERVYKRIQPYVDTRINYAAINDNDRICPSCGSTKLHKHDKRFISQFKQVQRYRCQSCGKISKGGQNLLKKTARIPRS